MENSSPATELLLCVFRNMRQKLIDDFKNNCGEIYRPIYMYSRQESALKLSIDKYFLHWVDSHFECFEEELLLNNELDEPEKENLRTYFCRVYSDFVVSFWETYRLHIFEESDLITRLLKKEIDILKGYLVFSDKHYKNLDFMETLRLKHKYEYEIEIEKIAMKGEY